MKDYKLDVYGGTTTVKSGRPGGELLGSAQFNGVVLVENNGSSSQGSFVLESGTVRNNGGNQADRDHDVIINAGRGSVTIKGGAVTTNNGAAIINVSTGSVNVEGGEVSVTPGAAYGGFYTILSNSGAIGTINVSDGTVSAANANSCAIRVNALSSANVSISGGVVTSTNSDANTATVFIASANSVLVLTGGTVENTAAVGNAVRTEGVVNVTGGDTVVRAGGKAFVMNGVPNTSNYTGVTIVTSANYDGSSPSTGADALAANITAIKYARFYALYSVLFYSESYDMQTPAAQTVAWGGKIAQPDNTPVRGGYYFDGNWYRNAALTEVWNFANDKLYGDITLYPGFVQIISSIRTEPVSPAFEATLGDAAPPAA